MIYKYTCSIIGARGYTGLETARLLLRHPGVELRRAHATSKFWLADFLGHPKAATVDCTFGEQPDVSPTDIVFLATPADVSLALAPKFLASGATVIDLSGAFRLKTSDYKAWYGFTHSEPEWLGKAVYGLASFKTVHGEARLIANPGCYATAALMALVPLLKSGVIDPASIVLDGKSGATGAGKKAAEDLLFSEVDGDCRPYRIGRHQHLPEIREAVLALTGQEIDPHFATHLLAVRRGLTVALYARLKTGFAAGAVKDAFGAAYGDDSLVDVGSMTERPELASLRKVVGTARTRLAYEIAGDKVFVFSAIDNLLKGAASQAVENMNLRLGFPVSTGLEDLEVTI